MTTTFSQLQPKEEQIVRAFFEGNVAYIEAQYHPEGNATFTTSQVEAFKPTAKLELYQELLDSMYNKGILTRRARGVTESGGKTVYVTVEYTLNPHFYNQLVRDLWSAAKPRPVPYEELVEALSRLPSRLNSLGTWFPDSRRVSGPTRWQLENEAIGLQRILDKIQGTQEAEDMATRYRERRQGQTAR